MSEAEPIVRIAAKGGGVTQSGRHFAGAVPGDLVDETDRIEPGPYRAQPACRHFSACGGCTLQHASEAALADFVTDRVTSAAARQGVTPRKLLPTHLSPPGARRRATLHAVRTGKGVAMGFRKAGSHRIVDLTECPVLDPRLIELVPSLRGLLALLSKKDAVDAYLTLSDQGCDVALSNLELEGLAQTEAVLDFARENSLARLSIDQGFGPETVWEPEPVNLSLSGVPVPLPVGAFLQATKDSEALMLEDAREWAEGASSIIDLFSGLGTFAFALSKGTKVLAAEADRAAHLACKAAARTSGASVFADHRDLFRNPYQPQELNRFDMVLLDPPRAGARAQIEQLAQSSVPRIAYISCNPSSWSRDAAVLARASFSLEKLRPVGQFRWSTHVELSSLFVR